MAHLPRLHLIAPDASADHITACAAAACEAGDVASILLPQNWLPSLVRRLQFMDLAVLSAGDPQSALAARADGVEIAAIESYSGARRVLGPDRIVGGYCGASRHRAMELAEAGADYVAFGQAGREDVISWWSETFEIPCIAADPVSDDRLDILLPHRPDFIRPDDAMWLSPQSARDVVARLTARLTA